MPRKIKPIHPGEILIEEFLAPMEISQYRLAKDISVPPRRINEIVHGKRAITADTALRLSRYFGMTEEQTELSLQKEIELGNMPPDSTIANYQHHLEAERNKLSWSEWLCCTTQ